jgi:glycosyltransferase involved in cell wall biosynthesis
MKILLLSTFDNRGGAARAGFRLCEGLRAAGHEAKMVVQEKSENVDFVELPDHFSFKLFPKFRGYLDLIPGVLLAREKILFSIGWLPGKSVKRKISRFNPDIIHLQWINKGFINLKMLAEINKPVVWTLHDMWAFTGGCHYSYECDRFLTGCGKCPVLHSKREKDLSWYLYKRKKRIYDLIPSLTIITPSLWLTDMARKSGVFGNHPVLNIPYAININTYKKTDMLLARKKLGLPVDKKLILFNAMNATTDERKGYRYLMSALESVDLKDIGVVIVGADRLSGLEPPGLDVHLLGIMSDTELMVESYNACDIFVLPSLQDNLPNTVLESLACATPVVGFNTGGIPDMIEHKRNGYLAAYKSISDLANGIKWCLYDADAGMLSDNARRKILNEFSEEIIIQKHVDLYQQLLNQ